MRHAAACAAEALESRCLLSAGDSNVPASQASILSAVSSRMQAQFVGSELELSPVATPHVATPDYVLLDQNPSLTAADALTPFSSSSSYGLTPAQVRHAYGIDAIKFGSVTGDGAGQTIAIIDAYDDPTAAADLHAFDQRFGLSDPPSFTKVNQTGGGVLPGTDPAGAGNDDWELEESLDIEWSHAMAPAANIILVEANSPDDSDLFTAAVGWARSAPGVTAVSMSFGEPEYGGQTSFDSLFTTPAAHAGVTFLASTGDGGAPGGYPAYSPNVVAVGGTTLNVDSSGNYVSETAWSGSGGGISIYEGQPAYQQGVVTQSSTSRTIPDVSFDADPNTGVAVYDSYDYGSAAPWIQVGGTSLSAPSWAGLIAIADQGRALNGGTSLDGATQTLPRLYAAAASDLHDITSGGNGYSAGPGYDLVTGRGTPIAQTLIPLLSAAGPYVSSFSPVGLQSSAPSDVDFNFSTAMDPTSFSVAADIDAFTGPGNTDLRSSITGFSWLNGNTTLQVDFTPPASQGPYTMTIGPQILSAGGIAMDQNQNGANGEIPADEFSGTFYYDVTPTQVAYANPASGSTVAPPFTTLDLYFSAPINPATIGAGNLTLSQGAVSGATEINSTTVQYTLSGILNGGTVTVSMAQGALMDANGDPILAFTGSYIIPAPVAPGVPALLAATDSGVSSSDDITNFDNSSASKALEFSVPGTIPGDVVSIYSDGTLIGSAVAGSTTTVLATNGTTPLVSGGHSIVARQSSSGVQGPASPALPVTILNTPLALPAPGGFDPTFNFTGTEADSRLTGWGANSEAIQTDGSILVGGGAFAPGAQTTSATLARYTAAGQPDPTFGTNGYVMIPKTLLVDQIVRSVAIQSDGKVVALIAAENNSTESELEVVRFNHDGSFDATFASRGIDVVAAAGNLLATEIVVQQDGKLLISAIENDSQGELIRLTSSGALDTSFNGQGYVVANFGGYTAFTAVALTPDGQIVVGGYMTPTGSERLMVARYTSSGAVDATFGGVGYVMTQIGSGGDLGSGLTLQPDGKIVQSAMAGTGLALVRYSPNGTLDTGFGVGGIVILSGLNASAPILQNDGKIVLAGSYDGYHGFIARFNANGTWDDTFGTAGEITSQIGPAENYSYFNDVLIQSDGQIIAVGVSHASIVDSTSDEWILARVFGASVSLALDPSSDSGTSNSDGITAVTSPAFDVPNLSGLYTRIYSNGVLVSPAYSSGGTIVVGSQPVGVNQYTLTLVDAAGNESPATAPVMVTIDTTPPAVALSFNAALSAGLSSYSFTVTYTDNNSVAGSTLNSDNVLVTAPDGYSQMAALISATPSGNAGSITATYQISPGTSGWGAMGTVYTFTLEGNSVTDVAGNGAPSGSLGTIAVSAVNPPGQPQLQAGTDSGVSSSDGITNFDNSSPAKALQFLVQGTAAGAAVTIYADGIAVGSAVATGTPTLVTTDGSTALSNGTHAITARQALSGSQTADSLSLSITIDTVGPAGTIVGPLVASGPDYNFSVKYTDATTGINVALLDSSDLLVTNSSGYNALAMLVSVSQQSNGSPVVATYQIAPPAGGWTSGSSTYTVSVRTSQVSDVAGNFAAAGSIGTLSLSASAAPAKPVLAAAKDSGVSQSDDITSFNNSSPSKALQFIVSSTTPGDTIIIDADGVPIGSAVAAGTTTTVTTDGSTVLADGIHNMTAQRAASGQLPSAPSASLAVTIETVGQTPAQPRLDPASDSGFSNSDGVTNVAGPTADVTVGEPGTVFLQVDGTGPTLSKQVAAAGTVAIPLETPASFQAEPTISTGQGNEQVVTGDFNGDGKQDIALAEHGVQLLFGNGDGTFQPAVTIPQAASVYVYDIVCADFNGDGKPDLWLRTASGYEVLLNNGDGTFQWPVPVAAQTGYVSYAVDIDGDGTMDIVGEDGVNSSSVSVWLGNGNGTFQPAYAVNAGLSVTNLVVGDINGDGKPDIVAIDAYTDTVSAMINLGDNTFASPVFTTVPNEGTNTLAAADFNGDGKADLMTGNSQNVDQVFLSNGNGTFTLSATLTTGYNCYFVTAGADLNGDGKADAVVGANNVLYVCYGNGNGTFQSPVPYTLASTPSNMALADFNGDGAPDIATTCNLSSNNVSILLATGGFVRAGTHTLTAWETDLAGNVSSRTASTSITIDVTPPTASNFAGPAVNTPSASPHLFTVTYSDNLAVYAASLGAGILVTSANGYSQLASLISASPITSSSVIVATYQVAAPAGGWTAAANGTYTAALRASQVSDTAGNFAAAGAIGTFTISITAATAQPQLLAISDTGISNSDGVTSFNNSTPGTALQFSVANTTSGATVTIYADGVAIGSTIASGTSTTVITNGALALADGLHSITARQNSAGSAQSVDSAAMNLTVDTTPPTVQLSAIGSGNSPVNQVAITFSEPTYGLLLSNLQLTLGGLPIAWTSAQTLTTSNHVTWTLSGLGSLTGTAGAYQLTLNASPAITDLAGNGLANGAALSWTLAATTTTLIAQGSGTSNATEPLTFAATVSGGIPDGETITLEDASQNNAVVATGILSGGSATLTVPAGVLLAGTHNLIAIYSGDSNFAASQSSAYAQTIQLVVTNVQINGNLPSLLGVQRSMVDSIVYTFSEAVNLSGTAATIAVHSGQSGAVPTLIWTALNPNSDGSATQWVVSFSGAGVVGNSIANGVYDITLNSADVTSDANPAVMVQPRATDTFYRLFGDINGDGVVNASDNFKFKTAMATYNAAFDYNNDGVVNAADNFQFKAAQSYNFSSSGIVYTF